MSSEKHKISFIWQKTVELGKIKQLLLFEEKLKKVVIWGEK